MNAEVIGVNDPLNAVKVLSPSVNDYKTAIENVFTTAVADQNPMDEYFVIFIGRMYIMIIIRFYALI